MSEPKHPLSRWWMPPVAVTALLLVFNSPWFRVHFADVYQVKQWVYGLHLEMNAAVWWSAVLYLASAALFHETACLDRARRRPYVELSLLMLAVVIDEIGSLHERISGFGGWPSLAPFGLLMLVLLVDGLRLLWRDSRSRPSARLIAVGFALLASVALQEYAEHNLTSEQWSQWWGRFLEEGTELVGALVILGGAVHGRHRRWDVPAAAAVADPGSMGRLLPLVVAGLALHVGAAQILYLPKVGPGRWYGNPAAIYPLILFFVLACHAFWMPRRQPYRPAPPGEVRAFWNVAGAFFLACSLGFVQNLWGLVGKVIPHLARRHFYEPILMWLTLILVVWVIGWSLRRRLGLRALVLLALPLAPLIHLRLEHLASKHLAAGLFACLCAVALLEPSDSGSGPPGATSWDT